MGDLLFNDYLGKPLWMWLGFLVFILILLALDLGVFTRKDEDIDVRKSLELSAFYIVIGLIFGLWIWHRMGSDSALEYYTGFVVEKSLSVDNLFVMSMIFGALSIPRKYQHRVLFWGILGVIILRGLMIGVGAAVLHQFEWVLYIFGAFLVVTGVKLMFSNIEDAENHDDAIKRNPIIKYLRKHFAITDKLHNHKFLVKLPQEGSSDSKKLVWHMTPLFLALITIEFADLIFAVDSVPAVFAITTDTYIVFTSNIFAILGLRALYFALAAMIERFIYLKYAVSLVLVFIGGKVLVPLFTTMEKVPPSISLTVTLGLLAGGVLYSLYKTKDKPV